MTELDDQSYIFKTRNNKLANTKTRAVSFKLFLETQNMFCYWFDNDAASVLALVIGKPVSKEFVRKHKKQPKCLRFILSMLLSTSVLWL